MFPTFQSVPNLILQLVPKRVSNFVNDENSTNVFYDVFDSELFFSFVVRIVTKRHVEKSCQKENR